MRIVVHWNILLILTASAVNSLPIPGKEYILSEIQRAAPTYVGTGAAAGLLGVELGPLGTAGAMVAGAGLGGLAAVGQGTLVGTYKRCKLFISKIGLECSFLTI